MSAVKNKRLRKQTFVFHKPLTNESPAQAGNRARKCGIREFEKMSAVKNKRLRKQTFVFHKPLTKDEDKLCYKGFLIMTIRSGAL